MYGTVSDGVSLSPPPQHSFNDDNGDADDDEHEETCREQPQSRVTHANTGTAVDRICTLSIHAVMESLTINKPLINGTFLIGLGGRWAGATEDII